jgi:hypothetical protein
MVASGSEIGKPAQNSRQLIQNISLPLSPMMSRISGYQHVRKTCGRMNLTGVIAAVGQG